MAISVDLFMEAAILRVYTCLPLLNTWNAAAETNAIQGFRSPGAGTMGSGEFTDTRCSSLSNPSTLIESGRQWREQ